MHLSLQFSRIAGLGACLCGALCLLPSFAAQTSPKSRILVYTRNYTPDGKGYVHDNIAASVAAIRKMGDEAGFAVDVSDDPGVFTESNLRQYAALVFSNSNNEAFSDDAQRDAFKRYIESGGGFVGIHSASGSERDWPYFWSVLGGKFAAHPHQQALHRSGRRSEFRRRQRTARAVYMDRRVLLSRPSEPGYPSRFGD